MRTKSKGLPIDVPYIYLMLFTYAMSHIKSKELPIDIPYTYLIFFTCAAPHTKSKRHLIDVPYIYLMLLHVQHRIQKARGSRLTSLVAYHLILSVHIELTYPD
jgi:hypothetical protein